MAELVPARDQPGGVVDPLLEAPAHVRHRLRRPVPVLGPHRRRARGRHHVEAGLPPPVGRDLDRERHALLVDGRGLARRDERLAHELLAPVAEHEAVGTDLAVQLAGLLQRVLHLEQVGEVGGGVDAQPYVHRFRRVVEDDHVLVQAVAHRAAADDRLLGVAQIGQVAVDDLLQLVDAILLDDVALAIVPVALLHLRLKLDRETGLIA